MQTIIFFLPNETVKTYHFRQQIVTSSSSVSRFTGPKEYNARVRRTDLLKPLNSNAKLQPEICRLHICWLHMHTSRRNLWHCQEIKKFRNEQTAQDEKKGSETQRTMKCFGMFYKIFRLRKSWCTQGYYPWMPFGNNILWISSTLTHTH